jgi:hypothetical protein
MSEQLPELAKPFVGGISVRYSWKLIEPRPGEYNWTPLDKAIQLAQSKGKQVMIRVVAGALSPEWLAQAGAQWAPSHPPDPALLSRLSGQGKLPPQRLKILEMIKKTPVPWDPVYLKHWSALIQAFGRRYDGNPAIFSVQMTGGGVAGEMTLLGELFDWQRYGYSDAKMIETWKTIIDAYRQSFPRTPTNLDILEPLRGMSKVVVPVVKYCLTRYPGQVYIQNNGLNAKGAWGRPIIRAAASKTRVGYQMSGGGGWIAATVGSRSQAFQIAIEDGASYLEVYRGDLTNPAEDEAK